MVSGQETQSQPVENVYLVRLRRLWKGTLYVCTTVIQIVVVTLSLVLLDWTAGLLILSLIVLSLVFRFVASEVDRIGWALSVQATEESTNREAVVWRRTLLTLLLLAMHVPSVILIWYFWSNLGSNFGIGIVLLLLVGEVLYQEIRRINRKVSFRRASYGHHDGSLLFGMAGTSNQANAVDEDLVIARKLEKLQEMASNGMISQRAFEKARDRIRVNQVLESDD